MANAAFKHVEQLLSDYPHYDTEITKRKLALAYPVREMDENIGGSHVSSNSSVQERYVVTLDQDSRINRLRNAVFDDFRLLKAFERRRAIERNKRRD